MSAAAQKTNITALPSLANSLSSLPSAKSIDEVSIHGITSAESEEMLRRVIQRNRENEAQRRTQPSASSSLANSSNSSRSPSPSEDYLMMRARPKRS